MCTETYGFSAEVVCTGNLRASIPYIPIHIDYMCAAKALADVLCDFKPSALVVLQKNRCYYTVISDALQPFRCPIWGTQNMLLADSRQRGKPSLTWACCAMTIFIALKARCRVNNWPAPALAGCLSC